MIGRVGSSRDRSFLCLLAIYAAHVALFHVFDIAPFVGGYEGPLAVRPPSRKQPTATDSNRTAFVEPLQRPVHQHQADLFSGQLRPQVFTASSPFHWDNPMDHPMTSYPKINLFLFSLSFAHRVKNIFATIALSSSTWGIISGSAIFLLTYTDRDNTLQICS